ncbi:SRPBCC family protein [Kitasatospora nipponensis]|uniref:SRPBCC family protein n=1 Tax=Kitasatospora nipponensis TaxID=258049 RepID=A0ABP4GWA7_9ACTN
MTTDRPGDTRIEAPATLPTLRITREFAAPAARVYRAWTEPGLVARWLGPRGLTLEIDAWDARTGGRYRYTMWREGVQIAAFYGSFHELRPAERLVQTFTYEDVPDDVVLETVTFTDLGPGRSRVTSTAVVDTVEARDAMLAGGMEGGVVEGYRKLDELLANG